VTRKRLVTYLATAGFFAWETLAMAQAPAQGLSAAAPGSAKIQFSSTAHDFGRVIENQIVRTEFTFTNTGNALLEIAEVRPTCGCTSPSNWDRRIEPGKTGAIPIQFNSADFLGPVSKSVTVFCNDPVSSNVVLQINALVWKPISVTPGAIYFSLTSDLQTNETRVAKITNNDEEEALVLSPPTIDQRLFKTAIRTNKPGKEYELEVSLVPPLTSSNTVGSIMIPTSSTKTPVLTVPVVAIIQPPVIALSPQLVIPTAPLDSRRELGVYVRNNESSPINVFDPSVSLTNVQVQVHEFQKGRLFRVVLDFPAGFHLTPEQREELTVKTSHPQVPLLKIPIIAKSPSSPTTAAPVP